MDGKDRQDLSLVLQRLSQQDVLREKQGESLLAILNQQEERFNTRLDTVDTSLHTIKVSLFDPHKGLWFETKKNSSFRKAMAKAAWVVLPVFLYGVVAFILQIISWTQAAVGSSLSP